MRDKIKQRITLVDIPVLLIPLVLIALIHAYGYIIYMHVTRFKAPPLSRPYTESELAFIRENQVDTIETLIIPRGLSNLGGIIQGEVIGYSVERRRSGMPSGPGRGSHREHLYMIYTIRIMGVYRGGLQEGQLIDLIQLKKYERRTSNATHSDTIYHRFNFDYILVDLEIGDNVILFLRPGTIALPWSNQLFMHGLGGVFLMDGFQSVYYYTPKALRYGDEHVFEPVHPLNNVRFTAYDLYRLTKE